MAASSSVPFLSRSIGASPIMGVGSGSFGHQVVEGAMSAHGPVFAYANGDVRRKREPDRPGVGARRRMSVIVDLASICIGGSLGTCVALIVLVSLGVSDGSAADVMTAAAAGIIAGGIADVQASGLWTRGLAAAAGACAGTAISLWLTAWFAVAVHSPLLGGQASGALGIALGASITMAISLATSRVKPRILDVAFQAGIVSGVAVCLAVGGAVGGLLAVECYRLVAPGAATANAEAIGIATGSGIGAFGGLIIGAVAGAIAGLFTILFSPSRSLPVVGPRNVSVGAFLVAVGSALAATTASVLAWFATVFAASALSRVLFSDPLASAIADLAALVVALVAGLATTVFVFSTAVELYFRSSTWERLWSHDGHTGDVSFEEILPMAAMVGEALFNSEDSADGQASGAPWLIGALLGLLVGAGLALGYSVGRTQATMIAGAIPLIAAGTVIGLMAGIRLQRKAAPNFENTRAPALVGMWEALYRSMHVSMVGLLAGVVGLMVGVVPVAMQHSADGKWSVGNATVGAATAIIVGLALARPLNNLLGIWGHELRNSSLERSVTRRLPPRPILKLETNLRDVWGMVLDCSYEEAIAVALTIDVTHLSRTEQRDLATATWRAIQGLPDGAPDRRAACEIVVAIHEFLSGEPTAGDQMLGDGHSPEEQAASVARAAKAFNGIVAMTAKASTGPMRDLLSLLGSDERTGRTDSAANIKDGSKSDGQAEGNRVGMPRGESKAWQRDPAVMAASAPKLPLSVAASDPVAVGARAYLQVLTSPGAVCHVSVRWHSGHLSKSGALKANCIANAGGISRWDWRVRKGTACGEARATVEATLDGVCSEMEARFLVTQGQTPTR